MLCGEGVKTGARVLVEAAGVPLASVNKIQLQRLTVNKDSDVVHNAPLQTVTPTLPCIPFQFHREYGTVSNPIQLLTGSTKSQCRPPSMATSGRRPLPLSLAPATSTRTWW